MAVRDNVSVQYFHDKTRAAELLNVGLLSGNRLIRPEDIEEADSVVLETEPDSGTKEKRETITKKLHDMMPGAKGISEQNCQNCLRSCRLVALRIVKAAKYIRKNPQLASLKQSDFCS